MENEQLANSAVEETLSQHAARILSIHGKELLANRSRESNFSLDLDGIYFDWSYQRIDDSVLRNLFDLAEERQLLSNIREQFAGAEVNFTEQRPALHTALRGTYDGLSQEQRDQFDAERDRVFGFAEDIRNGTICGCHGDKFTDIVHIGIGGSYLGQKLYFSALKNPACPVHFLVNNDAGYVNEVLSRLNPSTTLVIVASKSMRTPETLSNFQHVHSWLNRTLDPNAVSQHCVSISAMGNSDIPGRTFHVPESVGGRFSIWSAMALPVVIAHGKDSFEQFLQGAEEIDRITTGKPIHENPSLLLALLAYWNINCLHSQSHVVANYAYGLQDLVPYLQQLELESNGKSIDQNRRKLKDISTVPVWGGNETEGQHAWHQFLHQGTAEFDVDLICSLEVELDLATDRQLANCLAQRNLLFHGHAAESESFKTVGGNHGSSLLLLDRVDAKTIGRLIAIYEHKVAFLGMLWGVNSFDQFGVEHGKGLAEDYVQALSGQSVEALPLSDLELIDKIRKRRNSS